MLRYENGILNKIRHNWEFLNKRMTLSDIGSNGYLLSKMPVKSSAESERNLEVSGIT